MYHYTYLITFENGKKYFGARSSKLEPHLDTAYLGSGAALPASRTIQNTSKKIICIYKTRKELMQAEADFIISNNCVNSDDWYNLKTRTFDRHGSESPTKGMTFKYKPRPLFTERYGGDKRSAAMLKADESRRIKCAGKNPKKGKAGINNNGFVPWYYITPDGEYVEVYDKTKQEMAPLLGFTIRQLTHGFHKSNINKVGKTKPRKGWVFGNLDIRA